VEVSYGDKRSSLFLKIVNYAKKSFVRLTHLGEKPKISRWKFTKLGKKTFDHFSVGVPNRKTDHVISA